MTKDDKKILQRHLAIFLAAATIMQFTGLGFVFFENLGLSQLADDLRVPDAHASGNATIFLTGTASTTWTVPNDWSAASNTIEVIGGGGGGGTGTGVGSGGGGGGGGAYSKIANGSTTLTAGQSITIHIGAGGAAAASGTDTWFNGATCAGASVCAKAGALGTTAAPGLGGLGGSSTVSIGTTKFSGGNGANSSSSATGAGGGGGAAGPRGAGQSVTGGRGGTGDNGNTTPGGAPGAPGGAGTAGTTPWTQTSDSSTAGAGSGGGGANVSANNGGAGGLYGAGGGGGTKTTAGGAGKQGIIVITYTPVAPTTAPGTPAYTNVQSSTLTVSWTAATGSTQYDLQQSTDGNSFSHRATTTALTYNDSSLSPNTTYYYKVRGVDSTGDVGPYSASSSATTTFFPIITGFSNNTESLTDGGRSGDSIQLTGASFGTVSAGSRANCSGGSGTGCVQFRGINGIATTTVADSDVTAWTNTSVTFNVSTSLATLGGVNAVQIIAQSSSSNATTAYIYPNITSMATCANCNANAGREYNATDTDGIIMLSGDHFSNTTGTMFFSGNFNDVSATIHLTSVGSCTNSGWKGSATSSNTVCVEVPQSIADNVYSGNVTLKRDDASNTVSTWGTLTGDVSPNWDSAPAYNGYLYHINSGHYAQINATGSLGAWQSMSSLGLLGAGAAYNGYLYSMGGNNNSTTASFAQINTTGSIGVWHRSSTIPSGINSAPGVAYNGYLYALGGYLATPNDDTSTVYYAPINTTGSIGTWQRANSLPTKIEQEAAVAYKGYMYTVGGFTQAVGPSTAVNYAQINATGSLGAWQSATALPHAMYELATVAYNGYLYTTGGYDNVNPTSTVYYAQINATGSLGAWQTLTALPTTLYLHSAAIYNGYIYNIGGINSGGNSSQAYYSTIGKSDPISFTVLPRILTNTPISSTIGTVVQISGNHFCEDTVNGCPTAASSSQSSNHVTFGSTQALTTDFVSQTGGAGACNGSGAPWTDSEICVKLPSGTPAGVASTTITSNTSYTSNSVVFTAVAAASTIPGVPGNLGQYLANAVTAISNGSSTTSTTVVFKGNLSASTTISMQLQVEVTSSGSFACSGTGSCASAVSSTVYNSTTSVNGASVTFTNLASAGDTGTGYRWQARAWNTGTSEASAWSSSGSFPNFIVDTNPPTITSVATSSVSTSTATITWNTSGESADSRVQYATSTHYISNWSTTTVLPSTLGYHSAVVYKGYIYTMGGATGVASVATSTVQYAPINSDGSIGAWSTTTPLPASFIYHSAVAYNGYIYSTGGSSGGTITSTVYYVLINSTGSIGAWSTTTPLPSALDTHSAVVNNGYIYTTGGGNASGNTTTTIYYAPINSTGSLGAWTTTTMPNAASGHSAVVNNGYIYVTGGWDGFSYNPTVQYTHINGNGSFGAWSTTTALPSDLHNHTAAVFNGYIYTTGGNTDSAPTSTIFYALINSTGSIGTWSTATPLPNAIERHFAAVYNGYIYTTGGLDKNNNPTSTVFYAPFSLAASCATNNDCTAVTDAVPPGTNSHTVNLSGLSTSTFYYYRARSKDALSNEGISAMNNFTTTAAGGAALPTTGQLSSVVFDTGATGGVAYNSMMWEGTPGTGKVRFQLATSNSSSGPWNFIGGTTCTGSDYYDPGAADTPIELTCAPQYHNNQRYYKYLVQLCSASDCSSVGATSPIVTSVVVNWSP